MFEAICNYKTFHSQIFSRSYTECYNWYLCNISSGELKAAQARNLSASTGSLLELFVVCNKFIVKAIYFDCGFWY